MRLRIPGQKRRFQARFPDPTRTGTTIQSRLQPLPPVASRIGLGAAVKKPWGARYEATGVVGAGDASGAISGATPGSGSVKASAAGSSRAAITSAAE